MEYMSKEGYEKIAAELNNLIYEVEPKVKESLVEAREKGDLSENFEYHAARREHGKVLGRMRFLQRVLEHARILDTSNMPTDKVVLLSKVDITNLVTNAKTTFTIVSPHESNLKEGKISVKSPIAEGLLDKKIGDIVEIKVPAGTLKLQIDNITLL